VAVADKNLMRVAVADKNLMRAINRFKILHTIRAHKLILRVDITKSTGLSRLSSRHLE
jgi:hypothetical protein